MAGIIQATLNFGEGGNWASIALLEIARVS